MTLAGFIAIAGPILSALLPILQKVLLRWLEDRRDPALAREQADQRLQKQIVTAASGDDGERAQAGQDMNVDFARDMERLRRIKS